MPKEAQFDDACLCGSMSLSRSSAWSSARTPTLVRAIALSPSESARRSTTLVTVAIARVIDQDAAHQRCRYREEVPAPLPLIRLTSTSRVPSLTSAVVCRVWPVPPACMGRWADAAVPRARLGERIAGA
jgi:hypothetical protein